MTQITWQGNGTSSTATSGSFEVASNWSAGVVPGPGDDVVLPGGYNQYSYNVTVNGSETVSTLTQASIATLDIAQSLTVTGIYSSQGELDVSGQANFAGGTSNISANGVLSNCDWTVENGASLIIGGSSAITEIGQDAFVIGSNIVADGVALSQSLTKIDANSELSINTPFDDPNSLIVDGDLSLGSGVFSSAFDDTSTGLVVVYSDLGTIIASSIGVAAPSQLTFVGSHLDFSGNDDFGGTLFAETLEFSGGSDIIHGAKLSAQTIEISGADVMFNQSLSGLHAMRILSSGRGTTPGVSEIDLSSGSLALDGGTQTLDGSIAFSVSGGDLNLGTTALRLKGETTLSGGQIDGTTGSLRLQGGSLTSSGDTVINSKVVNDITAEITGGALDVNGSAAGKGTWQFDPNAPNASIEFGSAVTSGESVDFNGSASGTLSLDAANRFHGTVANFGNADTIDLTHVADKDLTFWYEASQTGAAGGTLDVMHGSHTVAAINLTGSYDQSSFALGHDGGSGTAITVAKSA